MKTEELMIGDWVMYEGHPYQIRKLGIYGEDRDGNDYPAVCIGKQNGIGLIVERNEIEPILITPVILEEIGFVLKPDGWLWCADDGNEYQNYIFIQFRRGGGDGFSVRKCEINFFNKALAVFRNIQYVHQLQHTMRICGINKEIQI